MKNHLKKLVLVGGFALSGPRRAVHITIGPKG